MKRLFPALICLLLVSVACNLPSGKTSSTSLPPETTLPATGAPGETSLPATPHPAVTLVPGAVLCDDPQPPFITDLEVHQMPVMDEPEARVPYRDPVFSACVVRVTDRKTDLVEGDSSGGMKNEYSRVQAYNADGTRMLVRTTGGNWYVYDASTLLPLGQTPVITDPRWDAADPALLYYFDMGTQIFSYNIVTKEGKLVHDFANDLPGKAPTAVWMRYEGSPSMDGRWWALMAQNEDWQAYAFLVYDLQTDTVTASTMLPKARDVDSVTMSPLGTWLVAQDDYCEEGVLGTAEKPCGLMVWNRDLTEARGLLRIIGHSDMALDATGREVMVYQDVDKDTISLLDLDSGVVTDLVPIDFSHTGQGFHFSGTAFQHPGWAVVSTHNGGVDVDYTWMDDQVFLLELKADGRVVRLAHTHSLFDENMEHDYWAEPQASANQDLTRILFTSNWGRTGTEEVDMYMITLPADWESLLP